MCACDHEAALSGLSRAGDGWRDGEMVGRKEGVERKGKGDSQWARYPGLHATKGTPTGTLGRVAPVSWQGSSCQWPEYRTRVP